MKIAVVGTGLVGMGWAIVFARAGHDVALFDGRDGAATEAKHIAGNRIGDLAEAGLVAEPDAVAARIAVATSLAAAVEGAAYLQESVFETVEAKRALFAEIDVVAGPDIVIGSSSSGIPASAFTDHVACRARCLIAHPVNPPYLIPLVELVPAPWTAPNTVAFTRTLMTDVGQSPIVLTREIEGFVLNRLQGALLREAWALYEDGIASTADIDRTVAEGLGLRWSFMGPFETIDLNAPGGIADYARRLAPLYARIAASRTDPTPWSGALVENVERERREALSVADLAARAAWRDRRLMALARWKRGS